MLKKVRNKALFSILLISGLFLHAIPLHAQEIIPDKQVTTKAVVLDIVKQETKEVPGTDVSGSYQTISVKILEGEEKDKIVTVENDYLSLKKGEAFYLMHTTDTLNGRDYYAVVEPYRLP